jgi:hypothetical protein
LKLNCAHPARLGELCPPGGADNVPAMGDSLLQQQLDEVRALLVRARELFGTNPVAPPEGIAPDADR